MPNKKMSPGEMTARTGKPKKQKVMPLVGASAGLTAVLLAKAFKKAKEIKPTGRINLDDLARVLKNQRNKD